MTILQKAQQKYKENLRNYYAKKDIYEDYYLGGNPLKMTKKEIEKEKAKMYHYNDILETLVYIFGDEVRFN